MINIHSKKINVIGATVVTPNFRMFDDVGQTLQYFRGIGWMPNNGQGHLNEGSQELDSFIRTYDDIIKAAQNTITRNLVIWQGKNGGSFQFGWHGYDVQGSVKNYNWDIIANEYETPTTWNGTNTRSNNALISCVDPSGAKMNGPFEFYNFNIDGIARNLIMLSLDDNGYLKNLNFYNLTVRGSEIEHIDGMYTKTNSAQISNIHFNNFTIGGNLVTSINDKAFKFHYTGNVDVNSFSFS